VLESIVEKFGVTVKIIFVNEISVMFSKDVTAVDSIKRGELKFFGYFTTDDVFICVG
jgi:hypothetical protein